MIGGHLVRRLLDDGYTVRASDIKRLDQWWQIHDDALNLDRLNCATPEDALAAVNGCDWVFDLAENMGGIGFITSERVACAESVEIGINLLRQSARSGVSRFFFASSACVYPVHMQEKAAAPRLRESDAWPADPEEGYGLAKLYLEELCRHYQAEGRIETRVARYHNVYGEHGSWRDGREKAPAALCRKAAETKLRFGRQGATTLRVWGDGRQTRSYCHVSDAVEGTLRLMASSYSRPLNIGTERLVTVDQLLDIIEAAAGIHPRRIYELGAAQGVRGRNADLALCRQVLGWQPTVALETGITDLYFWIEREVERSLASPRPPSTLNG
jgi:nucleoside-diphosphate-sugar epimerase